MASRLSGSTIIGPKQSATAARIQQSESIFSSNTIEKFDVVHPDETRPSRLQWTITLPPSFMEDLIKADDSNRTDSDWRSWELKIAKKKAEVLTALKVLCEGMTYGRLFCDKGTVDYSFHTKRWLDVVSRGHQALLSDEANGTVQKDWYLRTHSKFVYEDGTPQSISIGLPRANPSTPFFVETEVSLVWPGREREKVFRDPSWS